MTGAAAPRSSTPDPREELSEREGRIEAFLARGYHHQSPHDRARLVLPRLTSELEKG